MNEIRFSIDLDLEDHMKILRSSGVLNGPVMRTLEALFYGGILLSVFAGYYQIYNALFEAYEAGRLVETVNGFGKVAVFGAFLIVIFSFGFVWVILTALHKTLDERKFVAEDIIQKSDLGIHDYTISETGIEVLSKRGRQSVCWNVVDSIKEYQNVLVLKEGDVERFYVVLDKISPEGLRDRVREFIDAKIDGPANESQT